MRLAALLVTAGGAATLAGAGGAITPEHRRYDATMRPLLESVTEPNLFLSTPSYLESPFLRTADALKRVAAPGPVRKDHRRLVALLVDAERSFALAAGSSSFVLEQEAERSVRDVYATIRAICARGYRIARMCDA